MDKLRAVLVGAGGMGRTWAKNLLACDEIELIGWIDIRPEAAIEGAAALGLQDLFIGATLREGMLDQPEGRTLWLMYPFPRPTTT